MIPPELDYEAIISNEGIPILILAHKEGTPVSPVILYDGKTHAILYRTPEETFLLDNINPDLRPILQKAPFAVIIETTENGKGVATDYKALIKIIKNNPLADFKA